MNTPHWLNAYTTRTGNPDPRRAGRNARPHTCTSCSRLVLHGADHHRIAAYITVDPYAATPTQEAEALTAGIPTFELAGEPPTWELRHRTHPGVPIIGKLEPANTIRVVIEHKCGRPPIASAPLPTRAPRNTTVEQGGIPF